MASCSHCLMHLLHDEESLYPKCPCLQELRAEKDEAEKKIDKITCDIASDLGLIMDKTIRLEWYKVSNTRTRCLRITQVDLP